MFEPSLYFTIKTCKKNVGTESQVLDKHAVIPS